MTADTPGRGRFETCPYQTPSIPSIYCPVGMAPAYEKASGPSGGTYRKIRSVEDTFAESTQSHGNSQIISYALGERDGGVLLRVFGGGHAGLAAADQGVAMEAMQAINDSVRNFAFAAGFFGAPVLCAAAMVHSALRRDSVAAWMVLVGGAVYLIGGAGATFLFNVPLNEDLATLDPSLPENHSQMVEWTREWSGWNNVRTIASAVASIFLLCSLIMRSHSHHPTHN